MAQLEQDTTPEATGWYIITANRVAVLRVHSGMTIGENESGELSFEVAHAHLTLEIESNSSLVVGALGDLRLTSSEVEQAPAERISCNRSVAVSLAHNTLQLNTEFHSFKPARRPLRLNVLYPSTDRHEPVADTAPTQRPAEGATPPSLPAVVTAESPLREQMRALAISLVARSPFTGKTLGATAAVILMLTLGVLVFDSDPPVEPPAETVEAAQAATPSVHDRLIAESTPMAEAQPQTKPQTTAAATPAAPVESLVAADQASDPVLDVDNPVAPAPADDVELNGTDAAESLQPPPGEPVVVLQPQPQSQLQPQPQPQSVAAPKPEPAVDLPPAAATQARVDTAQVERARAAKIAQQERVRAQALQRELDAADAALAAGQLLVPETTSALVLYQRILSDNPDSPGALRGMASVREQLINRAFAQLAAGEWRSAAATLDAAEQAGASGELVADLRSEASYQLRLARAQAGQFNDLYPSQLLEAIAQKPPRVSRRQAGGVRQVEVEFTVTMRGDVRDIQILGNPPPRLADRIGRAVEGWRFEPVLENGRPLPVRTRVLIDVGN